MGDGLAQLVEFREQVLHILKLYSQLAGLEMNPLDEEDRIPELRHDFGSGMCNITRCCTEVCPEHINITDNGIIPMKERVVDRFYDPVIWIKSKITGQPLKRTTKAEDDAGGGE